ncbi:hypothetical protein EPN54_01115 [bacterium]|nr:MAG: hypothetical protein EPN54_01115 [bacterium]
MAIQENKQIARFFPRIDSRVQFRYQFRGQPHFESAVSSDISCGGLRFTSDRFIPVSTTVALEINLLNRVLRAVGRIAWSTPLPHSYRSQMGIQFVEFDGFQRQYLEDFVDTQLS